MVKIGQKIERGTITRMTPKGRRQKWEDHGYYERTWLAEMWKEE